MPYSMRPPAAEGRSSPHEMRSNAMKHLRLPVMLAAGSLALTACAGVGNKDADGGSSDQGSADPTPSASLNIRGFSGENEVAQSRSAAFKATFPGVTVKNNKGDFDAQQFLT